MWPYLAYVAIALLLAVAIFSPKPKIENARAAKLGDFQFPRSNYGDPVALVWGTVRQKSPITAWYGDYNPVAIKKKVKSGLFSHKKVTSGYKNYMGVDCVLCLGDGVKLKKFWAGTYLVWEGSVDSTGSIEIDKPNLFGGDEKGGGLSGTLKFFDGRFDEDQDSYLIKQLGSDVPAYNGFSRALFKSFYIGTGTTPKPFSFEIQRITRGLHQTYSVMPNGLDVNPIEVVYDAITKRWGSFGNSIDGLDLPSAIASAKTLYDEGLGMSLIVQSSITGSDLMEEVMRVADGIMYQDPETSKMVTKLIRKDYDISTLMTLDDSSIKSVKNLQKTTWENTLNQCRVTFKDRSNNYDSSVAIAQDFANINFQQRVKSTEISVPGCTVGSVANKLAARQLSLLNVPLYKIDITANRTAKDLRPGSVFIFSRESIGISNMVMRVTKIDFGSLTSNEIKLSCIQDRFSTSTPVFADPESSEWLKPSASPVPITDSLVFTPPAFLMRNNDSDTIATFANKARLYVAATAPSSASYSFNAMTSSDGFSTSPTTAFQDAPFIGNGRLSQEYLAAKAFDTKHDVDGIVVEGVTDDTIRGLQNLTDLNQARDGSALFMIGNELFIYIGFVDNGNGSVTLNNVYRSILDTVAIDHAQNDKVWFLSGTSGVVPELLSFNESIAIKLLDVTPQGVFDINNAPTINSAPSDRASLPLPPQNLKLNNSRHPADAIDITSVDVTWNNRSRIDTTIKVYDDPDQNRETGTETRIRWRVGGGSYTSVTEPSSSTTLDVAGKYGLLEVLVDTHSTVTSKYSSESDKLTMQLKPL